MQRTLGVAFVALLALELEVEGVRLIDWLWSLIDDPRHRADVHCETCT